MQFNYSYFGNTAVNHDANNTNMSFAPDVKREPTYFSGELEKGIAFREAISALHDVVSSDQRFKPKDKTAYKEWAAQREQIDWQSVAAQPFVLARTLGLKQIVCLVSMKCSESTVRRRL